MPARLAAALAVLLSGPAAAQSQVAGLSASFQSGQSFLTWTEAPAPATYRVYRSLAPIVSSASLASATLLGVVDANTSENARVTQLLGVPTFFRTTDLGPPLPANQGLFVHTVAAPADAFYAVTAVTGGVENTSIVVGGNALAAPVAEAPALPAPVLQQVSGVLRDYAHWVSNADTPIRPAMWNAPSRAFNFRVVYDAAASAAPRPVVLQLHARGGNFRQSVLDAGHPEAIVVSPDDWIGAAPMNTFWYGMNAAFPATAAYAGSPDVDYTDRRVIAELDFALAAFPTDPERVYARGASMGGIGALFLAYRHPERFAAAHAVIPKFDFGCQAGCWIEPPTGDLLWGSLAQNLASSDGVPVFDRLDLGFLASADPASLAVVDPAVDRPLVTTFNGRNDTVVGWPEKPPTYAAIASARQPAAFFWDDGTHGAPNPVGGGPWAQVIGLRRNEIWQYRIH